MLIPGLLRYAFVLLVALARPPRRQEVRTARGVWIAGLTTFALIVALAAYPGHIAHAGWLVAAVTVALCYSFADSTRRIYALAAPRALALVQSGEDTDRAVQAGAGVADVDAGRQRAAVGIAGHGRTAAGGLGDVVEGQQVGVGTLGVEALDLGIDDARVDAAHLVVGEAQALDHPGAEVLDEHVGLGDEVAQDLLARDAQTVRPGGVHQLSE